MDSKIFRLLRIEQQLIHLLKHHPPEVMDSKIFRLLRIEQQLIHLLKHPARGDG
ncbi:MAG: hypothetical protein F6K22_36955 [Okeania sp. SIO2F4]|uniref:hypothetical protein n=1 Tax=Okeania sp. SIO2F4 TaxID=2607790 RepID=UPI001428F7E5|nr:hypothetical protein [Okeania sp. SIO2F4]NES07891.1 hypothetical protein [Okeania sp. SIO2F4]